MTDEPALRTKTDVLDLVISFMMEHEKQMDQMLERLERLADRLSTNDVSIDPMSAPIKVTDHQAEKFTIEIGNLEKYGRMKSIKIDLDTPLINVDPKRREILEFLEEIEQIYKKD